MSKSNALNVGFALDWISMTVKGVGDTGVARALLFGQDMTSYLQINPMNGYNLAVRHPFGHIVMSNSKRADMGVHVMFPGQCLKQLVLGGVMPLSLIKWGVDQGAKITRLDLAIDVHDTPVDMNQLYASKQVKGLEGSSKKRSKIENDDGGYTIYFGSRKSAKMLRVYNKAAEQGLQGVMWTRFEMEIKEHAAHETGIAMEDMSSDQAAFYTMGVIKGHYNADLPLFQQIMAAPAQHVSTTKDESDQTLKWLFDSVSKTVAAQMRRNPHLEVWGIFTESVMANVKAQGGMPPTKTEPPKKIK